MEQLYRFPLILILISLALTIFALLRRRGRRAAGYVALLTLNGIFALHAIQQSTPGLSTYLSFILFALWVLIPSVIAGVARRALRRGDLPLAMRLLRVRLWLQPGAGLEREEEVLRGLWLVKQGRTEEAVATAEARLNDPDERDTGMRLASLDRILTFYVYGRRWQEAIRVFEQHGGLLLAQSAPLICGNMVRAYAEMGSMDQAARCQSILEQSSLASDPAGSELMNGARLAYLAHLGRVDDVDRLLGRESGFLQHLNQGQRYLWRGLSRARSGDLDQAKAMWKHALATATDEQTLAAVVQRLETEDHRYGLVSLSDQWAALTDAVTQRALAYCKVPRAAGRTWNVAPVTTLILLAVVAVHIIVESTGGSENLWALVRYGANFRAAVEGGEWWRLAASVFLHGNWVHLALNAYALLLLGRFVEQLYGSMRFFTIYMFSGLVGAATTTVLGEVGHLSVGASGAIFGLLGAAVVGLRQLQGQVPERWRKGLTYNLLLIIALQLYIGATVEVIDNAAHTGGLLAGALAAILIPRVHVNNSPVQRRPIALLLLIGVCLITAATAIAAIRYRPAQLFDHVADGEFKAGGLTVRAPAYWVQGNDDEVDSISLVDPLISWGHPITLVILRPHALLIDRDERIDQIAEEQSALFLDYLQHQPENVTSVVRLQHEDKVNLKSGFAQTVFRFNLTGKAFVRVNLFRQIGDYLLVGVIQLPEERFADYGSVIARVAKTMSYRDL